MLRVPDSALESGWFAPNATFQAANCVSKAETRTKLKKSLSVSLLL